MRSRHRLILSAHLLVAVPLLAQADEAALRRMIDSKKQVQAWLEREARRLTGRAVAEIASPASWEKVREQRVREMRDMLGLLPWPQRTLLNVKITGTLDKGSYTIEKLAFESVPKFYVESVSSEEGRREASRHRLCLRPRLGSYGIEGAVSAARHIVCEERVRCADSRSHSDPSITWRPGRKSTARESE
jgi:hypothetical protein